MSSASKYKTPKNSMRQLPSRSIRPSDNMRDSIWSAPGYTDDIDIDLERMEETRPQRLLREAFLKIPGDSWQAKLDHCASCKCCTRHQTFRPSVLVKWSDSDADRAIKLQHRGPKCNCDCRHMARFICRQVEIDGTTPPCPRSPPTLDEEIA